MAREVSITLKAVDEYSTTLQNFNTQIGGIGATTTQLGDASKKTDSALGGMADSVKAGIVAFAGWKGAQLVGDMLELGQKSNIANSTFKALTETMGGAEANMSALKSATGGVVDNVTLLSGANKLLQMGLATNTDEIAKMSGMAVHLGASMGMDATKSMSDFSLMLANNSIMRLDQFGISSGEVRKKIIELQAATDGLSRSDAFKMAVMEIGERSLNRLGDAALAAETPINRLSASVQNMAQSFAGDFTTGANALVGILQIQSGTYPGQAAAQQAAQQQAALDAQSFAKEYYGTFSQYIEMAGASPGATDDFKSQLMFKTMEAFKNDPGLDVKKFISDAIFNAPDSAGVFRYDASKYVDAFVATFDQANADIAIKAKNTQGELTKKLYGELLAGDSGREFTEPVDFQAEKYAALLGLPDDRQASVLAQREAQALADSFHDAMNGISGSMSGAFGSMGYDTSVTDTSMFSQKLDPAYMKSLVPQYMDQSGADEITRDLRTAQDEFAKLQGMADQKLISDDQLDSAKNMVDNLSAMSDEAQKAATAFKNLTLAQAFGQSGGGMQGEMTDSILKQMKDSGASPEAIAAMQAELDKASGRETESSEEMKTVIVPMMAKMSAKEAAKAMANLDAFLKTAVLQGLTEDQIAAMMPSVVATGADYSQGNNMAEFLGMMGGGYLSGKGTGGGGAGSLFDDEKTHGKGGAGGKGGSLVTTVIAQDMSMINKDSVATTKSMDAIDKSVTSIQKNADAFAKAIASLPASKSIVLDLSVNDPSGVLALLKSSLGGTSLAGVIRDNGGTLPGGKSATTH